jgi:foldase protein PrsA
MLQLNKSRLSKGLLAGLALVLALGVISGCGNKNAANDKVVATYKGGQITQSEFDKYIGINKMMDSSGQTAQMLANDQFKSMVEEQLLSQEAALKILSVKVSKEGKKAGDDQIAKFQNQIKTMPKADKDNFDKSLTDNKITQKDLEAYIKETVGVMTDMNNKVTDKQIQDEYDKNKTAKQYDVVNVRHILIGTKDPTDPTGAKQLRTKADALKRAQEVKAKLDAGGKFEDLAKQYSDDAGSKDKGGLYESVHAVNSGMVQPFETAMNTLPIGKISDPVESEFGYHIMKVDSRTTQTLAEVKDGIKQSLSQNLFQQFMQKDFPTYEFKSNLPKPSPSPSGSPAGSAAPSPAPAATGAPSASPAGSAAPSAAPSAK